MMFRCSFPGVVWVVVILPLMGRAQAPAKPKVAATVKTTPAATSRAKVSSVRSADPARFDVPQVQLPDAAVAARINRALVTTIFADYLDTMPQPLTARRAIRQAQAEYQANDQQGMFGFRYEVLYNDHHLLSLQLLTELSGAYAYTHTQHVTYDLRLGRTVRLAELITDTLALQRRWQQQINQRVTTYLDSLLLNYPEFDADALTWVQEIVNWNPVLRRVELPFGQPGFTDFALTPTDLRLYHDFYFPHADLEVKPDYAFSYASLRAWLRPAGPLGFRW